MNKVRRALLISMPMGAAFGLSGCSFGTGDAADAFAARDAAFFKAQALKVSGSSVTASPDAVFAPGTPYQYFLPDATLLQSCLNLDTLFVTLWEGVDNHHRSLALKLPAVTEGKVYNLASVTSGDAFVAVTVAQFDEASGMGSSLHYEYLLRQGTVTVTGLSGFDPDSPDYAPGDHTITLVFSGVVGTPTTTNDVSNNVASKTLQLNGTVQVLCREEGVEDLL
jgi:hypothetical protein